MRSKGSFRSAFRALAGVAFREQLGAELPRSGDLGHDEKPSAMISLDDAVAFEPQERIAEALVVDAQRGSELSAGQRSSSRSKRVADLLSDGRWRWWCDVILVRVRRSCLEMSVSFIADECDADGIGRGRAAVFEGEHQAAATAHEIGRGVGPGMQVSAAAQGLSELGARAFTHVVNDCDRDGVLSLQLSKQAEQARDVRGAVLVDAVHAYERVEQQQRRSKLVQGRSEAALIIFDVKAKAGGSDDMQIELCDVEPPVPAQTLDAPADLIERVLSQIDERGSFAFDFEASEASRARGHGDREIESKPGFA